MYLSFVAISVGASLGASLRWLLGTQLSALFPSIPPGTLAAIGRDGGLRSAQFIGLSDQPVEVTMALSPEQ